MSEQSEARDWSIDDPRPIQAGAIYTFFLPQQAMLEAVALGDCVKATFRPDPADRKFDAERMWVKVTQISAEGFTGLLDSDPCDIPQLAAGMPIFVPRTHVLDVSWAEGRSCPPLPPRREYWDRCMVDDCVLGGRSLVDYLYREEPELQPNARFPDSGWRIRGSERAIAEDESLGRSPQYVALGAVLNRDDRWLQLVDLPVGSGYRWSPEVQDYLAT